MAASVAGRLPKGADWPLICILTLIWKATGVP
jgi:hypothetical protein